MTSHISKDYLCEKDQDRFKFMSKWTPGSCCDKKKSQSHTLNQGYNPSPSAEIIISS